MAIKREKTEETTVQANPATDPSTDAGMAKPKRGPKPGSKRGPVGPVLRWNDPRDAALFETVVIQADGGTVNLADVVSALQTHEAFAGETRSKDGTQVVATASLLETGNVKAALDRIREKLEADESTADLAALLPQVEDSRKRGVPIEAFRQILAARQAAQA